MAGPGPSPRPPAPPPTEEEGEDVLDQADRCAEELEDEERAAADLPEGRAVAALSGEACLELLRTHEVDFEQVEAEEAEGVETPIRLLGPLGGVEISSPGRSVHDVLDCRLAVALLAWAPALREAGVARIRHMSMYRPHARVRGTGGQSGHSFGLAIDAGAFVLDDGTELVVEEVWTDRRRRAPPCEPGPDDGPDLERLRRLVCTPAESGLFQIVLTPHFDAAHRNHVHLEVRPDVDWSCLH